MAAGGAGFWRFGTLVNVAAVGAMPLDRSGPFENFSVDDVVDQLAVTCLVELFYLGDLLERMGDLGKTFFFGDPGEIGVDLGPFQVFARGRSLQV
jgi:hypothetical protein